MSNLDLTKEDNPSLAQDSTSCSEGNCRFTEEEMREANEQTWLEDEVRREEWEAEMERELALQKAKAASAAYFTRYLSE